MNMEFMKKPIWDYQEILRVIRRGRMGTIDEPVTISSELDAKEIEEVEQWIETRLGPSFVKMTIEEFRTYLLWVIKWKKAHGGFTSYEMNIIAILNTSHVLFDKAFIVTDASYMVANVRVFFDNVDIHADKIVPFSKKPIWTPRDKTPVETRNKMFEIAYEYGCLPIVIHTFYRPFNEIGSEAEFMRLANESYEESRERLEALDNYM